MIQRISKAGELGGIITLNAGQGSSKNWAAGAEKFSLSLAGYLSVYARYKSGRFKWENTLRPWLCDDKYNVQRPS